jgi:RluA family pseudouridine synthase
VHAAEGAGGVDLFSELRAGRPGLALLHRLDREASGLVLLSKRPEASAPLQAQLEAHAVERTYLAVCAGRLAGERRVDRAIPDRAQGRAALSRPPPPGARPARSWFRPLEALRGATLVEVRLETGRKHQIRVHAASIGHPLLGDRRYAGAGVADAAPRLALHAARLAFTHPGDGRRMVLEAPLPPDLAALVAALR